MSVYITSLVKPYLSCTSLLIDNFLSNWDSVKGVFQMFKGSMGRMAIMLVDQYPKLSHVGVGLCNKVGGWVAGEVTENDRDLGRELILAVLLITVYLRSDHKPRTMDDHAEQGDYRYARMMMLAQILLAFSWIPYLSALAPYILHPLSLYWNISLQTILTFWAYAPYIALAVLAFAACSSDAEHHVYLARPGRFWEDPVLDWLNRRVNPTWDMQRRREYVVPVTEAQVAYWRKYLPLFPDTPDPRELYRQLLSAGSSSGSITPPLPQTPPAPKLTLEERLEIMEARLEEQARTSDPAVWGIVADRVGRQPRRWTKFGGDENDHLSF